MKLRYSTLSAFNPIRATRLHGPRYGFFALTKAALVFGVVALAVITLLASYGTVDDLAHYYQDALAIIKIEAILGIYAASESLYWRFKFIRDNQDDQQ